LGTIERAYTSRTLVPQRRDGKFGCPSGDSKLKMARQDLVAEQIKRRARYSDIRRKVQVQVHVRRGILPKAICLRSVLIRGSSAATVSRPTMCMHEAEVLRAVPPNEVRETGGVSRVQEMVLQTRRIHNIHICDCSRKWGAIRDYM